MQFSNVIRLSICIMVMTFIQKTRLNPKTLRAIMYMRIILCDWQVKPSGQSSSLLHGSCAETVAVQQKITSIKTSIKNFTVVIPSPIGLKKYIIYHFHVQFIVITFRDNVTWMLTSCWVFKRMW